MDAMDASNIKPDLDRLVKGFTSLDPAEFDGAINEFFRPDAVVDNSVLKVKGTRRIQRLTALQAFIADGNELIGKPSYDENKQVVDFEFKRTFKYPPIIPSLPILSSFFSGKKNWYTCKAQFRLKPLAEQGKGGDDKASKRMYVSQIGVKERPQPPLVNFVLYHFLRPFFSLVAVGISFFASFYYRHIKDTWVQFFFAAINEFFQGVVNILLSVTNTSSAEMDQWKQAKGADLRKLIEQAKEAAGKAGGKAESQAKKGGVPVDDLKQRAGATLDDAQREVVGSTEYFDHKQEQVKEQVKDSGNGNNSGARSNKGGNKNKTDKSSNSKSSATGNNTHNDSDVMNDVPQTPLGGHDPTASNAPSFAQAVEATSNYQRSTNHNEVMDGVPQTPLGGHDPTAQNAPSYAQAANE